MNKELTMDQIVALCKNRGFLYPGSEIYGGLANSWDYGPLGVEFKNNVKKAWWKKFVQESPYNVGLDAGILMNLCLYILATVLCVLCVRLMIPAAQPTRRWRPLSQNIRSLALNAARPTLPPSVSST